jgi:hypothetical protein
MSKDEKFCPISGDLCKKERCSWWNANFKACAILILSMTDPERLWLLFPKPKSKLTIERLTH